MSQTKEKQIALERAMHDFAIRVLSGNGSMQETVILPEILHIINAVRPPAATDGPTIKLIRQEFRREAFRSKANAPTGRCGRIYPELFYQNAVQ